MQINTNQLDPDMELLDSQPSNFSQKIIKKELLMKEEEKNPALLNT